MDLNSFDGLAPLERYRFEFPVTDHLIYFNHAAVSPISRRVAQAMQSIIEDVLQFGAMHSPQWNHCIQQVREKAAQLIGASASEIAFIKNTSEGISFAANGLDLGPGDKVVSVNGEFPANIYPWMKLQKAGVELDLVEQHDGCVDVQEVIGHLDARTKVLALSFVQFLSGYRSDLKLLGAACRCRNIIFVVDAIQGLGAFPLNVSECQVDVLSADSHKWLLGPEGVGILYCSNRIFNQMRPSVVGWTSVKNSSNYLSYQLEYKETAAKFECGTLNTISIYGLGAALDLILEIGIDNIKTRLLALNQILRNGLAQRGYQVYGPKTSEESSGIISFSCPKYSSAQLNRLLQGENIEASSRCQKLRVSPHFYNSASEVNKFLQVLPQL